MRVGRGKHLNCRSSWDNNSHKLIKHSTDTCSLYLVIVKLLNVTLFLTLLRFCILFSRLRTKKKTTLSFSKKYMKPSLEHSYFSDLCKSDTLPKSHHFPFTNVVMKHSYHNNGVAPSWNDVLRLFDWKNSTLLNKMFDCFVSFESRKLYSIVLIGSLLTIR